MRVLRARRPAGRRDCRTFSAYPSPAPPIREKRLADQDRRAARGEDRLADVIDVLASTLTGHLRHEERDGLPLIGVALTAAEWRRVGFKMVRRNGMSAGGEMFAWILDGADPGAGRAADSDAGRAAALGQLPPPLRLLYRAVWKPRYDKTPRW